MKTCGAVPVLLLAISAAAQQASTPAAQPEAPAEVKVECLPVSRASELIGARGCVAGRISRVSLTRDSNQHISLRQKKGETRFHAIVPAERLDQFGDLSYLRGQIVMFIGNVKENRKRPEMVLQNREQIRVFADGKPTEFDASHATGPVTTAITGRKRPRVLN